MIDVLPSPHAWLLATLVSILAFFAPIEVLVCSVVAIVFIDFILGIWAAAKMKVRITSNKMRKTLTKFIAYLGGIICVHIIGHGILGDIMPLTSCVATIIALAEAKSCLENLTIITGRNPFGAVINALNDMAGSNRGPAGAEGEKGETGEQGNQGNRGRRGHQGEVTNADLSDLEKRLKRLEAAKEKFHPDNGEGVPHKHPKHHK